MLVVTGILNTLMRLTLLMWPTCRVLKTSYRITVNAAQTVRLTNGLIYIYVYVYIMPLIMSDKIWDILVCREWWGEPTPHRMRGNAKIEQIAVPQSSGSWSAAATQSRASSTPAGSSGLYLDVWCWKTKKTSTDLKTNQRKSHHWWCVSVQEKTLETPYQWQFSAWHLFPVFAKAENQPKEPLTKKTLYLHISSH